MKITKPIVALVNPAHIFSRSAVRASMLSGPVKRVLPWLAMGFLRRHEDFGAFYGTPALLGKRPR
jgi:hypothetical protein